MNTPERIDPEANWIDGALWEFRTSRYTIALFAEREYTDPRDSFDDPRDVEFACKDDPSHWFCAVVAVYNEAGDLTGYDSLGGCSYGSFEEFYCGHRWQYSRRQGRWIKDPKSRAWKACEARRPRRPDGSRMDGQYFPDMVRRAIREARTAVAFASEGSRRA